MRPGPITAGGAFLLIGYRLLASGRVTLDTGIGRRVQTLGPLTATINAPRDIVFDVIATPYLQRTPRGLAAEIEVLERGADLVLAAHRTPVTAGLTATTVETVRFENRAIVHFRLVRGPVPHVVEKFVLHDSGDDGDATRLDYTGELGTDFWWLGRWWGNAVARKWESTVKGSIDRIRDEAERRSRSSAHHRPT